MRVGVVLAVLSLLVFGVLVGTVSVECPSEMVHICLSDDDRIMRIQMPTDSYGSLWNYTGECIATPQYFWKNMGEWIRTIHTVTGCETTKTTILECNEDNLSVEVKQYGSGPTTAWNPVPTAQGYLVSLSDLDKTISWTGGKEYCGNDQFPPLPAIVYQCVYEPRANCDGLDETTCQNTQECEWVEYNWDICYSDVFGSAYEWTEPHGCTGSNKVAGLEQESGSYAEIPDLDEYPYDVCYGDMVCQARDNKCLDGGEMVLALEQDTGSNITDPNYIPPDAVSMWRFEGDATDSVGGNNGTINGAVFVDGMVGEALEFNGVDNEIDLATPINLADGAWTISYWFYDESVEGELPQTLGKAGTTDYYISHQWGGAEYIMRFMNIGTPSSISLGPEDLRNSWHHVTLVPDGSSYIIIYIDGQYRATSAGRDNTLFVVDNIGHPWATTSSFWKGKLDEIAVFNRTLNPEEIVHLYNQGAYEKKICCYPWEPPQPFDFCGVRKGFCLEDEINVFQMESKSDAHASSDDSYPYKVCCGGIDGLGKECSGDYDVVVRLFDTYNSHVEAKEVDSGQYPVDVCLSSDNLTHCMSYDGECSELGAYGCVASISNLTNAHVGDCNAYDKKICCYVNWDDGPPAASVSINDGDDNTTRRDVVLNLSASYEGAGIIECGLSNDDVAYTWESCSAGEWEKDWILSEGEGEKSVYFQVRDRLGITAKASDTIILNVSTTTGELSCTVRKDSCEGDEVNLFQMSSTSNAHASSDDSYPYKVCCGGVTDLQRGCYAGYYDVVIRLFDVNNSHAETKEANSGEYNNTVCLNSPVDINCLSYNGSCSYLGPYECVASISGHTNAHVGECGEYESSICCHAYTGAPPQELWISINNGDAYTMERDVVLSLVSAFKGSGVVRCGYSSNGVDYLWEACSAGEWEKNWTLSEGEGLKTVYFMARDRFGKSAQVSDTIILDTSAPEIWIEPPLPEWTGLDSNHWAGNQNGSIKAFNVSWGYRDVSGMDYYEVQYRIGKSSRWPGEEIDAGDPVARYSFDSLESGQIPDQSGNGNNGTVYGNTRLLMHFDGNESGTLLDGSIYGNNGTVYGDTRLLMHFDEGDGLTARDSSAYGNNGELLPSGGEPEWRFGTDCMEGPCLEFDYNYIDVNHKITIKEVSISTWVKFTESGQNVVILGFCNDADANCGGRDYDYLMLRKDENDKITFGMAYQRSSFTASGYYCSYATDDPVSLNEWFHLAVTYDPNNNDAGSQIYINGTPVSRIRTCSGNQDYFINIYPSFGTLAVGNNGISWHHTAATYLPHFKGNLDEFALYTRALSQDEVEDLFETSRAKFIEHVPGRSGGAVEFDGKDDYVELSNEANFDFERTDAFSISAWVNETGDNINQALISKGDESTVGWSIFTYDGSGKFSMILRNTASTNDILVRSDSVPAVGEWNHIVVTYDGSSSASGIKYYLNGDEKTINIARDGLTASILNNENVKIGKREDSTDQYFNGSMDEVAIYSRALSLDEIRDINATGRAGFTDWTEGYSGSALEFDGVDDYVEVPDNSELDFGLGNFSVATWVKINEFSSGCGKIVSKRNGSGAGDAGWQLQEGGCDAGEKITFGFQSDAIFSAYSTESELSEGEWYHVAVVVDERESVRIYINGVGEAIALTEGVGISNHGSFDNDAPLVLGALYSSSGAPFDHFNGAIDDVSIFDRALTLEEIRYLIGQSRPQEERSNGAINTSKTEWMFGPEEPFEVRDAEPYYFRVRGMDRVGRLGEWSAENHTSVDSVRPVINMSVEVAEGPLSRNATINSSATDSISGIDTNYIRHCTLYEGTEDCRRYDCPGTVGPGLYCTVREDSCEGDEVNLFQMGLIYNAHASVDDYYPYKVCCGGIDGIGKECSADESNVVVRLKDMNHSHVETKESNSSGYNYTVCLSSSSLINCSSHLGQCSELGNYKCVASVSNDSNAHVGDCDTHERKICCSDPGAVSFCNVTLNYGEGMVIKFRGRTFDYAGNMAGFPAMGENTNFYITDHPLANFFVHKVDMLLGDSTILKVYTRNMQDRSDNISVNLTEYDFANFVEREGVKLSGNRRVAWVGLNPYEEKVLFVRVYSSSIDKYVLYLNATSTLTEKGELCSGDDCVKDGDMALIVTGYPSEFPGLNVWAVLVLVAASLVVYSRVEKALPSI